jgi:hypothetical protein
MWKARQTGVSEMKKRTASRVISISLVVLAGAAFIGMKGLGWNNPASKAAAGIVPTKNRLVVHEWGTFTSISGVDGVALEWRPLNGPTDLPGFVHTIQGGGKGLRHPSIKADLAATVRMETPVLYFYSDNEMDVSVKVDFPKGKITEWYPQARDVGTSIDWGRLKVMPGAAVNLPVEYKESHYYPARETDSAPIQVCATDGKLVQQEKFLFYRGVGTFDLPVSAKLEGDKVALKNLGKDEIAHVIVFENRGGKIGYRLSDGLAGELTQARPELDKNFDSLVRELKRTLVASGLYEKEADAMIKTWRDNWFEEGLRVFYILPRRTTDAVLPVTIEPRPTELVRVLVGRTELITPEMEKSVQRQVSLLRAPSAKVREDAAREIRKYGRFSEPILKRILETEKDSSTRHRIQKLIDQRPEKAD